MDWIDVLGWVFSWGVNRLLNNIFSKDLPNKLQDIVKKWSNKLPTELSLEPETLFLNMREDSSLQLTHAKNVLKESFEKMIIPPPSLWYDALIEQYYIIKRKEGDNAQLFFRVEEEKIRPYLNQLSELLSKECEKDNAMFKSTVLAYLKEILSQNPLNIPTSKLVTQPINKSKQWKQLLIECIPVNDNSQRSTQVVGAIMATALYNAYIGLNYKRFISILEFTNIPLTIGGHPISAPTIYVMTGESKFAAAVREAVYMLKKDYIPKTKELEVNKTLKTGWTIKTQIPNSLGLNPFQFIIDYDAKSISILLKETQIAEPLLVRSNMTTSDAIWSALKIASAHNRLLMINVLEPNPSMMKMILAARVMESIDLMRIRVNVEDADDWDYDFEMYDEAVLQSQI